MKNISLEILDEYAQRITNKQANKLYEAKNGKPFEKELFEKHDSYSIYLNEYTALDEAGKSCVELTYILNEKHPDWMNRSYYKISEDGLTLRTSNKALYEQFVNFFAEYGIAENTYCQ